MAGDGDVLRILAGGAWARKLKWPPRGPPTTSWDGVEVENGRVTKLLLFNKGLTGSIPKELGNLTNLKELRLYNNQLTGSIPSELGRLTKLTLLNFRSNQLTGSIPKELGNLTNLTELILGRNELTGSIPPELGRLQKLKSLDLRNNQLSGSIPRELGQLQKLEYLSLQNNQLTGSIPPELGELMHLQFLDLDENQLTGAPDSRLQGCWAVQEWRRTLASRPQQAEAAERLQHEQPAAAESFPQQEAERLPIAHEAESMRPSQAATPVETEPHLAAKSLEQWLQGIGFAPERAIAFAQRFLEEDLHSPEDLVDVARHDPTALQLILDAVKLPVALRSKLMRGVDAHVNAAPPNEEVSQAEAAAKHAEELGAASSSDVALWLQDGGFAPMLAAEITVRMKKSGVGGRRFLQKVPREVLVSSLMPAWDLSSPLRAVFLRHWDQLQQSPQAAARPKRTPGFDADRYGPLVPLRDFGGQSNVFLSHRCHGGATGAPVIVKRMDAPGQTVAFMREVHILQYLKTQRVPSVPHFEEYQLGSGDGDDIYHYMVMEKGSKSLRRMAEDFSKKSEYEQNSQMSLWVSQTLDVLRDLHKLGIVWGDLKPENFVGSSPEEHGRNGELLGIDFGACAVKAGSKVARDLSRFAEVSTTLSPAAGQAHTALYVAPERARHILAGTECPADPALDMWALGMVVYWLATGRDYFASQSNSAVLDKLAADGFAIDPKEALGARKPAWCVRLLKRLLQTSSSARPTADAARQLLDSGRSSVTTSTVGSTRVVALLQQMQDRLERIDERSISQEQMAQKTLAEVSKLDGFGRMLHEIVQGELECPRLFVLLPADRSLWQAPQRWFSNRMQLHFFCAYGHPSDKPCNGGEGFSVLQPKEWVKKHAGAVQASLLTVKLAAGMVIAFATSGVGATIPIGSLFSALNFDALDFDALDMDSAVAALGQVGKNYVVEYVDGAFCKQMGEESAAAPAADKAAALRRVREATGQEYRSILQYMETAHAGWQVKLGDLRRVTAQDGEVGWLCHAHAEKWRVSTRVTRSESNEAATPPLSPQLTKPVPVPVPVPVSVSRPQQALASLTPPHSDAGGGKSASGKDVATPVLTTSAAPLPPLPPSAPQRLTEVLAQHGLSRLERLLADAGFESLSALKELALDGKKDFIKVLQEDVGIQKVGDRLELWSMVNSR